MADILHMPVRPLRNGPHRRCGTPTAAELLASGQVIPFALQQRKPPIILTQVGIAIDSDGRMLKLTTRVEPLHVLAVLGFALEVARNMLNSYIDA